MNNADPRTFSHGQGDTDLIQAGAEPLTQSGWKAEWTRRIRGISQANRLPRGFREESSNLQFRRVAINVGVAPLAEGTSPADTQEDPVNWADMHQASIKEAILEMTSMAPAPLKKPRKKAVAKSLEQSQEPV